jgi:hypothetical protein
MYKKLINVCKKNQQGKVIGRMNQQQQLLQQQFIISLLRKFMDEAF